MTTPAWPMPLPWHAAAWSQLQRSWQAGRLPHALLLHGMGGLGKFALAQHLAQSLLCEQRAAELAPCGHCASCKLFVAGSHPDLVIVTPEEDKQQISVDQIRATNERLAMTSARSGYRVAIIEPAHQMTVAAANSLLKTLEEPGANSLLMLVTSQAGAMLATIRSRCQQLGLATPSEAVAQQWLAQQLGQAVSSDLLKHACGAPLRALVYAQGSYESLRQSMQPGVQSLEQGNADLAQLASTWADDQLSERLHWLDAWLSGRLGQEILRTADPVTPQARQPQSEVLNINHAFQCLDKLRELKAQLRRTALQKELALETVLLLMQRALIAR